jgi:heptosyltransferase-1
MKVLLFKTSSLGDLIHCFPALTDASQHIPGIRFDWVVEEAFAQVPAWHPAVDEVIPIALRRWRRNWRTAWNSGELKTWYQKLRSQRYDLVLDAQGLVKSALPARLAHGPKMGYDHRSIREPLASFFYQQRFNISRQQHAIDRNRLLMGKALGYQPRLETLDYGLVPPPATVRDRPYLVFLHATTWASKHWAEVHWVALARLAVAAGFEPVWPWYGENERLAALRMQEAGGGELAPALDLDGLAALLVGAAGVVGVDSGLSHLAAALDRPGVALYGPTSAGLTGVRGRHQQNLEASRDCAPCLDRNCRFIQGTSRMASLCMESLESQEVWQQLQLQMMQ